MTTDATPGTDPAPNPHATEEQVKAALTDTKLAHVLYHDWEAETYDEKWSISFNERCIDYARGRFDAVATDEPLPYGRAMELGCGTGFFLLNLMQSGVAAKGSVTDLSPGMVKVALRNAENLGLDVDGRVADNPIGANVQTPGFDFARLTSDVVFERNERAVDGAVLPIPESRLPGALDF